ncbi:MAG: alanine/glycine:cation symporter family protein [Fusobacterium sp.]
MSFITGIVDFVNNLLWGKNILVVMLIGTALYFTVRTRFMQFRLFGDIVKILGKTEKDKKGISSLETFFLGTACRVGAGNIAGVVAAVSIGGPGSLFWMWLVALLGSSTSFIESTLAVIYRDKIGEGKYIGGTPWVLKKRLNVKFPAVIYAVSSIICYIGVTQVMSNSVTESVSSAYNINPKYVSIALALIVASIIFGKSKRDKIIDSLNKIVPVMAALYLGVVIFVIVTNITSFPAMIKDIFYQAFGGKEFLGGSIGGIIMQGVRRGLFSNEAGSGNSNYAAAVVDIDEPAQQGMVQALGVFVDTLVICSATAFVILLAGVEKAAGTDGMILDGRVLSGMTLFQESLKTHVGWIGIPFTVVTIFFFSLSTILAVAFYGKSAVNFINEKINLNFYYQIIIVIMVYIGGIQQNFFVWSLADFGLGIMTVINIICILIIGKDALEELRRYEPKLRNK